MNQADGARRVAGGGGGWHSAGGRERAEAAYPDRPITMIVPWGAGGGTDATARIIASMLEKELGQPVNVVNRTGGSGVVGHSAIADGRARRLHDRHHHRRDRHDALAGPDRAHLQGLHAARRWSTRTRPACRCAPTAPYATAKDLLAGDQGRAGRAEGLGHRPGRHLAPGPGRHAADGRHRSGRRCRGCRARARHPACRISSPAASRSCPARCRRRGR